MHCSKKALTAETGSVEKYDPGGGSCPVVSNTVATTVTPLSQGYTWTELEITGVITNVSPRLWDFRHLTKLYLRNNSISVLPRDVMRLQNLLTLDVSSNKLRDLPAELGELFTLQELLVNNNSLSRLPYELVKLFQLQKLGLKGNPLPANILNLCNETNGTQKLLSYLLDNLHVSTTRLPARPWIPLHSPDPSRPIALFTVMCYNILCDKYCTRQLYGYCPQWALNWNFRKQSILEDIRGCDADILTLQEVETEQFYNFFEPELQTNGYKGIFSPKSRARTMLESERKHVDGCAIFYKTSKFRQLKEYLVEFNQLAIEAADGSHDMINRVMTKDNIGLAALLETVDTVWENSVPSDSRQAILVATCHVHWDPEFCDVKLIQTMMLMHKLQGIIKEAQLSLRPDATNLDCNNIPLILCGDLNSLPESGVVEYLTSGRVNANHKDFKAIGYEDCLCKLSFTENKDIYSHGFRLMQAYNRDIMPYTNYTYDFKGIIDYVFYSRDVIRALGVLGPPDTAWFHENRVLGCPHPQIPSDHLPLFVQFEMTALTPNRNTGSHGATSRR